MGRGEAGYQPASQESFQAAGLWMELGELGKAIAQEEHTLDGSLPVSSLLVNHLGRPGEEGREKDECA